MAKRKLRISYSDTKFTFITFLSLGILFIGIFIFVSKLNDRSDVKYPKAKEVTAVDLKCQPNKVPFYWCAQNTRIKHILIEQTGSECVWVCKDVNTEIQKSENCPLPDKSYQCPLNCSKQVVFNGCEVCKCR